MKLGRFGDETDNLSVFQEISKLKTVVSGGVEVLTSLIGKDGGQLFLSRRLHSETWFVGKNADSLKPGIRARCTGQPN